MKTIDKLKKLTDLIFEIQEKDLATTFIRYAGHTNQIDVTLYPGGWDADKTEKDVIFKTIYCDYSDKKFNDLSYFQLLSYLQEIILTNKIEKP